MLFFVILPKRIKNTDRIMIIAHSPKKEDFKAPSRILAELYTPKLVKLETH